jgi:hypothetical protein
MARACICSGAGYFVEQVARDGGGGGGGGGGGEGRREGYRRKEDSGARSRVPPNGGDSSRPLAAAPFPVGAVHGPPFLKIK